MTEIQIPGIYFDLPAEDYHAYPALSASGIKDILVSPLTYYVSSPWNPNRVDDDPTEARVNGTAAHVRVLEGKAAFDDAYAYRPDPADYPEALAGHEALKAKCRALGLKMGGSSLDLCARIREVEPDAVLWPDIEARVLADSTGKTILPAKKRWEIELPAKVVECYPEARKAFGGGYPEVSIFWVDRETGVPMKCRIDFLKIHAVVELKTFTNTFGMAVERAVARAITNYRYHVQLAVYLDGVETIKEPIRSGKATIEGVHDPEWLADFAASPEHAGVFVFLESGKAPNCLVKRFRRHIAGADRQATENLYWSKAMQDYRRGVERFVECRERFGDDMWIEGGPMSDLKDEDFPLYMFEE